jgi:uncharacterized membrane protein YeiH
MFYTIDILGTIAFAISGVLVAMNKKMDLFCILIIAFVTAVGGGTRSACFGGGIRDILCSEIPVIFRKEIYATACIFGGLSYFLIRKMPLESDFVFMIAGAIVILIRLLAVKFKIALPNIYKD